MFGKFDSGIEIELRDRIANLERVLKESGDFNARLKKLEDEKGFYSQDITEIVCSQFITYSRPKQLSIQNVLTLVLDHLGINLVETPAQPEKLAIVAKTKKNGVDKRK